MGSLSVGRESAPNALALGPGYGRRIAQVILVSGWTIHNHIGATKARHIGIVYDIA